MDSTPHRRYNPLNDTWLIVAPQRVKRPWQGQVHAPSDAHQKNSKNDLNSTSAMVVDSKPNPLAPGATRANGKVNPVYDSVYVFDNDFPALTENDNEEVEDTEQDEESGSLFVQKKLSGHCEVMCFHPRSDLTLPRMSHGQIRKVIDSWCERVRVLGEKYEWVQIFENKGDIMGCSNPHPHCQIWSGNFLPQEPYRKDVCQKQYLGKHGRNLLVKYASDEMKQKTRVVVSNEHFVVVVPFWAVWPYETLLLPLQHRLRLTDLDARERDSLADIMKQLTVKYDNLFKCSFPYSMGFHGAPTGKFLTQNCDHWQLHAQYLPPLLRSASVKKFMAGYELLCEPQRDITPESAAETLRALDGELHYLDQPSS